LDEGSVRSNRNRHIRAQVSLDACFFENVAYARDDLARKCLSTPCNQNSGGGGKRARGMPFAGENGAWVCRQEGRNRLGIRAALVL
jgi:hypothetical protein